MTVTATVTGVPAGPVLLEVAGQRLVRLTHGRVLTAIGLHTVFRDVVADALWVEHATAVVLADELLGAIGEHLLWLGQHPHATLRRTVADWLGGATLAQVRHELTAAATWWRHELAAAIGHRSPA